VIIAQGPARTPRAGRSYTLKLALALPMSTAMNQVTDDIVQLLEGHAIERETIAAGSCVLKS
jgi:hypothetical protein